MRILIVDNYDSFTHNLFHYVKQFEDDVDVIKNDKISLSKVDRYDKIILSPGPGLPDEHKNLKEIIKQFSSVKSILGVCLGHQAIGEYFGAKLINLKEVMHGVSSKIILTKDDLIFKNIPDNFNVGHYHSWVIDEKTLPCCFDVTSKNENGIIMSIAHKVYDLKGVQFHPESILTQHGHLIIKNWLNS
ncbi:MAG: aminodeoxychorismate/anthranilate synthase component II [Flavobacteriales bacterium]|nr:aminodeoxychorismate/anthranilate synthase component II [Flavobacteriales bacterium]